jgi:hypothetical protein
LHISKKEQARRFKKLSKDPLESWHVQPEDWVHHRKYNEYVMAIEEMLERTDTEWGPWTIVEATDRRWTRVKIFDTIIRRLEEALEDRGLALPAGQEPQAEGEEEQVLVRAPAHEHETLLAEAGLSSRVQSSLQRAGLVTVGDVMDRLAEGDRALLALNGIGPASLAEIRRCMAPFASLETGGAEVQGEEE